MTSHLSVLKNVYPYIVNNILGKRIESSHSVEIANNMVTMNRDKILILEYRVAKTHITHRHAAYKEYHHTMKQ